MCYNRYRHAGHWAGKGLASQPPVNITETENSYTIHLFAPSLNKDNISITTQNDILSITYKEQPQSNQQFRRREYRKEEIERSFELKGKVNMDAISATYSEGVLTVELPKNDAAKRPIQQVNVT